MFASLSQKKKNNSGTVVKLESGRQVKFIDEGVGIGTGGESVTSILGGDVQSR